MKVYELTSNLSSFIPKKRMILFILSMMMVFISSITREQALKHSLFMLFLTAFFIIKE